MFTQGCTVLVKQILDLRKRKFRLQKFSNDVFTADPKKAFRTALKRAEIKDFSFHTT